LAKELLHLFDQLIDVKSFLDSLATANVKSARGKPMAFPGSVDKGVRACKCRRIHPFGSELFEMQAGGT
jgi:hypothetical protein